MDNKSKKTKIKIKNKTKKTLKIPKIKAYKLKIGVIKKGQDGKLWKVINKDNKKIWIKASIKDINCYNYLHNSIKTNITKYKNNNKQYKSVNQAIAIAYSMTKKKFPKCKFITKKKYS